MPFMISLKEANTCYYSPGTDKHSCCTHPHYCIFNENRIQLEKDIRALEIELEKRMKDLKFIKNEGTSNCADYEATTERITIINFDLERLRKSRNNILGNKEVKGYGFIQL